MKTLLHIIAFLLFSTYVHSQTDRLQYIESIEKYIHSYESDSLEIDIVDLQTSGFIQKRKFKLFKKTIGGFYEYMAWIENQNQVLFNFRYGENYLNKRKYIDYDIHYYFKDNNLVKYYKLTESKKYIYKTVVYFKDNEIISLENTDPDFNPNDVYSEVKKIKKNFETYILQRSQYQ